MDNCHPTIERGQVPVHRIGGWRTDGPTAYTNMYLWTVSTLFYMWRDAAKAVDTNLQVNLVGRMKGVSNHFGIIRPPPLVFF